MSAIFKREFKAYFITPIGYIVLTAFLFFEGMFFSMLYQMGSTDVTLIISSMSTVVLFVLPFITMKMLSEDKRQKVDQILLTAPVSVTSVILGKFFAALAVFALAFVPNILFQIIVSFFATSNWLKFIYCFIGMMLLGCTMISIGMFISSLTESSVIAAVLTIVINIIVMMITSFASSFGIEWLTTAAKGVSYIDRFGNFTVTLLNPADIVYFLSITVLFIFLSVRSVEKRRWS